MRTIFRSRLLKVMILFVTIILSTLVGYSEPKRVQLNERERVAEHNNRGYTWPPQEFQPNVDGWKNLFMKRFQQIERLEGNQGKWDGYIVNLISGTIVPNLTETGWGLTKAPMSIVQTLRDAIHDGLKNNQTRSENDPKVVLGPNRPLFIDRTDLTLMVLHEMHPLVEAWVGMKLVPYLAYGFRLYQNESQLLMHIDRTKTHVVSFILHIDSSDDSEPWPIVIEDYQGNTNEVVLQSGDMLLYESAKCLHGRPYPFRGSWYTSVFVHYYPVNWMEQDYETEAQIAVRPFWDIVEPSVTADSIPALDIVSSGMREPECPHGWCNLQETVKWEGPGKEGYIFTSGGKQYHFYGKKEEDDDDTQQDEL